MPGDLKKCGPSTRPFAFAALKEDGTVQAWGAQLRRRGVPGDLKDVRAIYSTTGLSQL